MRRPERLVVPVAEETARVEEREVPAGAVRITKRVREEAKTIDVPLEREELVVERRPAHAVFDAPPEPRTEGDCTIVPVVEEVVVVEKKFLVREEVVVRRARARGRAVAPVTLRRQEVEIERIGADGARAAIAPRAEGRSEMEMKDTEPKVPPKITVLEGNRGPIEPRRTTGGGRVALWLIVLALAIVVIWVIAAAT